MNAAPNAGAVEELKAILDGINAGTDKNELIGRLYRVELRGGVEEAALLSMIASVRGWRAILAGRPKPERSRPALHVVSNDDEGDDSHNGDGPGIDRPDGLPEGWSDPEGWRCAASGIWRLAKDPISLDLTWKKVLDTPIWIGSTWHEVKEHTSDLLARKTVLSQLCWPGGSETVGREVLMVANRLQELSGAGAPVSSANAKRAVEWLEVSEKHNARCVPSRPLIRRVGWIETSEGLVFQTATGPYQLYADKGFVGLADALRPAGTWDRWLAMARKVAHLPVPALALAASVASCMIDILDADPFVLDMHIETSKGKTSALYWAASAWGRPGHKSAYTPGWSDTQTSTERTAAFLYSLPMCMDDTMRMPEARRGEISDTVYSWGDGKGKGRGGITGKQESARWSSILISTGEASLSTMCGTAAGGMNMRILPVNEVPFDSHENAVAMKKLRDYGHLGPRVAAWALANRDTLAERHGQAQAAWARDLGGSAAANRVGGYLATVQAGIKALAAQGVPLPEWSVMRDLMLRVGRAALVSADIQEQAFQAVQAWVASQPHRVYGKNDGAVPVYDNNGRIIPRNETPPANGWIGRVMPDGGVALVVSTLKEQMAKMGFSLADALPKWREKGRAEEKLAKLGGVSARLLWLHGLDWSQRLDADCETNATPPEDDGDPF